MHLFGGACLAGIPDHDEVYPLTAPAPDARARRFVPSSGPLVKLHLLLAEQFPPLAVVLLLLPQTLVSSANRLQRRPKHGRHGDGRSRRMRSCDWAAKGRHLFQQ